MTEPRAKHRRVLACRVARLSRSCAMLAFGPPLVAVLSLRRFHVSPARVDMPGLLGLQSTMSEDAQN